MISRWNFSSKRVSKYSACNSIPMVNYRDLLYSINENKLCSAQLKKAK